MGIVIGKKVKMWNGINTQFYLNGELIGWFSKHYHRPRNDYYWYYGVKYECIWEV